MKLKEYKSLSLFIYTLFDFFKENGLTGSLGQVNDYDRLAEEILDSQFLGYTCSPSIEHYTIKFRINHEIEDRFVDLVLFGNNESERSTSFTADIYEKEDKYGSFFSLSWYEEKIPPFMKDFINEEEMILTESTRGSAMVKVTTDMIMSFDEFEAFLRRNREQKNLKMIEVD